MSLRRILAEEGLVVPRRASEGLHQLYLERLLRIARKGNPEWSSGPARSVAVLERMLKYLRADQGYMLPKDNEGLFESMESRGVPSWELEALRAVPVPQRRTRTPRVNEEVLTKILDLTGLGLVLRGRDRTPEHNAEMVCWYKAFMTLKAEHPRVWGIFKKHARKIAFDTHGRGSEDASWEDPVLVIRLKGTNVSPAVCLSWLVHEIGHAFEDEFNIMDLFDIYGSSNPPFISAYAQKNVSEDFAETFRAYWREPSTLKRIAPKKYQDMHGRITDGLEQGSPKWARVVERFLKTGSSGWGYHGTVNERMPLIRKLGLDPRAQPRLLDFSRDGKWVYFADNPDWARGYGGADILLRFPWPRHSEEDRHPISDRVLPHQFRTASKIPLQDLEVETSEGWEKLGLKTGSDRPCNNRATSAAWISPRGESILLSEHSQRGGPRARIAIVKKHPEGYYCLYDSKGKRPLNCWDKRYKKKPSDEVVQKAEKIVQFWKHQ